MRRHEIGHGAAAQPVQPWHDKPVAPRPPPRPLTRPCRRTIALLAQRVLQMHRADCRSGEAPQTPASHHRVAAIRTRDVEVLTNANTVIEKSSFTIDMLIGSVSGHG